MTPPQFAALSVAARRHCPSVMTTTTTAITTYSSSGGRCSSWRSLASSSSSNSALFVYGTLMAPEVLHALLFGIEQPLSTTATTTTALPTAAAAATATTTTMSPTHPCGIATQPARLLYGMDFHGGGHVPFQLLRRYPVRQAVYPALIPIACPSLSSLTAAAAAVGSAMPFTPTTTTQDPAFSAAKAAAVVEAAAAAAPVWGLYLPFVTEQQWRILDWFEGEDYQRQRVTVELLFPDDTSTNNNVGDDKQLGGNEKEHDEEDHEKSHDAWNKEDCGEAGRRRQCQAYIWVQEPQRLIQREVVADSDDKDDDLDNDSEPIVEWSYSDFRLRHLATFLREVINPCVQELRALGYYNDNC